MYRTAKLGITMLAACTMASLINVSPANAAGGPSSKYSCTTTAATDTQPRTATCYLPANNFSPLSSGDTNVVPGNDTGMQHVTDVSRLTFVGSTSGGASIGSVSFGGDSDGNYGAGVFINRRVVKPFDFTLTFSDGTTTKVTVNVDRFIAPAKPIVKKGKKRGTIVVTEPDAKHNGAVTIFSYGSFKQSQPDGQRTLKPGKTYVIRVKRSTIDWVAYRASDGAIAGSGHVKGIKLKKK